MSAKNISANQALELLMEGNHRFVNGLRSVESFLTVTKIRELAEKGQSPFAIVLACSDSRVPAEIVFDQGLGDLFVIRVAGNVVAPSILASIEFAAMSFGTSLCVVMGHLKCGAIKAAIESHSDMHPEHSPNLRRLISKIEPAVAALATKGRDLKSAEFMNEVTVENVSRTVKLISKRSSILHNLVESKKLTIAGALYDIHTGVVEFHNEK